MVSANILLLPSYRQRFGSVIIEVIACSLPTIAYRIDGVTDTIVDGGTGLLVNLGDMEKLEKQTIMLVNNPILSKSLGFSARVCAWQDFFGKAVTRCG